MKRLSVGFQGTVDHTPGIELKFNDAEGHEIFARDNFARRRKTGERNGFVHVSSTLDSPDLDNDATRYTHADEG